MSDTPVLMTQFGLLYWATERSHSYVYIITGYGFDTLLLDVIIAVNRAFTTKGSCCCVIECSPLQRIQI